jgi:hypothetical protein
MKSIQYNRFHVKNILFLCLLKIYLFVCLLKICLFVLIFKHWRKIFFAQIIFCRVIGKAY